MNEKYPTKDVILTIGDMVAESIESDAEILKPIKICAKVRLNKQIPPTLLCAEKPHAWHLWLTQITSNFSHITYITWTKPTKRQLRKWKRVVRKINH